MSIGRRYGVAFSVTSPNSATLPIATVIGAATVRSKIYEIELGSSSVPADNSGRFNVTRCSTTGTPGSSPTPAPLDSADPASLSSAGLAVFSVGPTLGTVLIQWAQNQRATYRWIAAPDSELTAPATASNGFAFMNPTVNSTFLVDGVILFAE